MIIGVTGTRNGMTAHQERQIRLFLRRLDIGMFHHGDCVGVDAELHDIIREISPNTLINVHPPTDPKYRAWKRGDLLHTPAPYLTRNRHIVDASEFMIAVPDGPERKRSGTWSTVRYAIRQNVNKHPMTPVRIFFPDGTVQFGLDRDPGDRS